MTMLEVAGTIIIVCVTFSFGWYLAVTINKKKVIKCKNCKHRYEPCRCALWYETADGKEYFLERGENFSCPWGERRTKDEKTIS